MTTFFLIRHGSNDLVGKAIAGRLPGISLNREGKRQAERLAVRLAKEPIELIFSSPLERAIETAVPLAKRLGLDIQISDALNEIDFGDWTRQTFEHLETLPRWQQWNSFRSGTRIPDGELMLEVQLRMVAEIHRLRKEYPDQTLALFSHGDPIRAALAYYLGVPLDLFQRIEVDPASASILALSDFGPRILRLNG
jgi:probable phosphomutase (TIGR03848 family)